MLLVQHLKSGFRTIAGDDGNAGQGDVEAIGNRFPDEGIVLDEQDYG